MNFPAPRKHAVMILLTLLTGASALLGSPEPAGKNEAVERQFDGYLKQDNLREWMRELSSRPHHVGSPKGKQNADFIAAKFKSWGYQTKIETFYALFPEPIIVRLEMIGPTKFTPVLQEPALAEDGTSNQQSEQLPIYNAYSIDGDVTAEIVYVNYGTPADYEELAKLGVDVKGKIVIARYGGSWRGIKPKVAAEHGAIGCILYSDPRDDGYFQGDVYPKGAYKNEHGAQRGSVMDMPTYPGDPLTPGKGATKKNRKFKLANVPTLTSIPVMPISYSDATPLLKAMEGPMAPVHWRGALPLTYHLGPGPTKVHMQLEFDWKIVPVYNVIATLKGSVYPNEWVLRGNHHDAWVNGANDPLSGLVSMMEEARGIGELVKSGWRPKRTIKYAAWDSEEQGLIGSTEWVETHADELRAKAVVYINTDGTGRGFLGIGGSHTLEDFVNQVLPDVADPQTDGSVADRRNSRTMISGNKADKKNARAGGDARIAALGSGSDYSAFLQHLGIASLALGFSGESGGGSYHSIYDSFDHYTRFSDTNFDYGVTLAKITGRMTLRMASADVLPFEFQKFTATLQRYVKQVVKLADDMRDDTEMENRLINEGHYRAVADPTKTFVVPQPKSAVPHLNFAPLHNAMGELEKSTQRFNVAAEAFAQSGKKLSSTTAKKLNKLLYQTERSLTRKEGLPLRPWYKHFIYAPGFYTGYGVKTLPGVREAIEQRNWQEVEEQIPIVAEVLTNFAEQIVAATEIMKK
ncbi:MAG: M28 family peptidase [Candidatus Marinimicrobia bacterium]|nr:M28 family peptidase [Candidatus Neomarinimicrobiota bacterium]